MQMRRRWAFKILLLWAGSVSPLSQVQAASLNPVPLHCAGAWLQGGGRKEETEAAVLICFRHYIFLSVCVMAS